MCVSHPKRFKQLQQVQIRISANRLGGKSVGEPALNRFRFRFESVDPPVRLARLLQSFSGLYKACIELL